MNALSGDTYLFAEVNKKYGVYTLRELYELHNQGHKIKVPALLNERGEKGWVEVDNVVSYGNQSLKRITLATSRLFLEISEDAIIPAYSSLLFSEKEKEIKLKFKCVNELKVKQDVRYNNTLLLSIRIPLDLPEGNNEEWEVGFALGFFVSEGTFHYRKHKNTKRSLATLNGYAKKKGMTLEEYQKYMTDIERVTLSVGESDFERGYIQILQKHFKFSKPYKVSENGYQICSSDLSLIHLIKEYPEGHTSHDKHLKNEVYNRSLKFLEGIMDGFLSGDGSFYKNLDLFQVGITTNYRLFNDLIFLSKTLGYDIHLHKGYVAKSPSGKLFYGLSFNIFKNWHRRTALGLVKEHIKKIEDVGEKEAFNLVLKPLYPENDKRSVFNHLFFTAFGILVSDAVKTLDRSALSSSSPVPVSSKGLNKEVGLKSMRRVDVYVSDEQYEKWKQKAESEGMSVSSFVKKAVESAFSDGFEGKKDEMIAKLEERVSDLEYDLDLVMFALDKVDNALKKLNRGEKLDLNDFVYSNDEGK